MSFCAPSRRVAALVVALSGLAMVLSGAFVPAATAAPTTASVATVAVAAKSSWFVDPRTPAQRRAEVAVPRKPKAYRGKVRKTRAMYRTRAGALAVPTRFAFGHQLSEGQALTLSGRGKYSRGSSALTTLAKRKVRQIARSLVNASSVRCEGYEDYSGRASKARSRAKSRATKVCRRLARHNPGLRTSTVSYGLRRPAVVGGVSKHRQLNRRVVIEMTGTRRVPSVPSVPQSRVPGAPVIDHVTGIDRGVSYGFAAPASDGGSPITGYQVNTGTGWEAVRPLLGRSARTACRGACDENLIFASLTGLAPETTITLRVRALNKVGAGGPSNSLSATVFGRPSAPTNLTLVGDSGTLTATFDAPEHDGGSEVDSYEISYDGGETWSSADVGSSAPYTVTKTGLDNGTTYDVRVRAGNRWGSGPSASAQVLLAEPGPRAYRAEYYYNGAQVWTYVFFTTVPGALSYEAQLDGGEWLPITIEADWVTEKMGRIDDPVCGAMTCTGNRTIRVRAVTADGPGNPGNLFPVTYFAG